VSVLEETHISQEEISLVMRDCGRCDANFVAASIKRCADYVKYE